MRPRQVIAGTALALLFLTSACGIPRWPIDGTMSSPYGVRFMGVMPSIHRGVDIPAPHGTEVRAMAGGHVRFAGVMGGYGNVVWIDHGGHTLTVYAHLSEIHVRTGDPVRGRRVIGLSGSSGNATGAHLHFEIWRRGRPVDPVPLLGGFPRR